jgi:dTDP-4-dehydrorhamnose reductase
MSKTKIVVLGGSGMLGSMLANALSREPEFTVSATVRSPELADRCRCTLPEVDWRILKLPCRDAEPLAAALKDAEWIINAIGITKPYVHDDDPAEIENALRINSLFPYDLAAHAAASGARLLQIATDCVYSGREGLYSEASIHDPFDVYGKTKSLGEVAHPVANHLRCSIIGPEPKSYVFLAEWFRRQAAGAEVSGFTNHQWNGITTLHFARLCAGIIRTAAPPHRVQHVVPAAPVSKYDLLRLFAASFGRPDIRINPVEAKTMIDRTLTTNHPEVNRELWSAAGYEAPPTIARMVEELAAFDYRFGGPTE